MVYILLLGLIIKSLKKRATFERSRQKCISALPDICPIQKKQKVSPHNVRHKFNSGMTQGHNFRETKKVLIVLARLI